MPFRRGPRVNKNPKGLKIGGGSNPPVVLDDRIYFGNRAALQNSFAKLRVAQNPQRRDSVGQCATAPFNESSPLPPSARSILKTVERACCDLVSFQDTLVGRYGGFRSPESESGNEMCGHQETVQRLFEEIQGLDIVKLGGKKDDRKHSQTPHQEMQNGAIDQGLKSQSRPKKRQSTGKRSQSKSKVTESPLRFSLDSGPPSLESENGVFPSGSQQAFPVLDVSRNMIEGSQETIGLKFLKLLQTISPAHKYYISGSESWGEEVAKLGGSGNDIRFKRLSALFGERLSIAERKE